MLEVLSYQMNILAFSDLHRNRAVAQQIVTEAGNADLIVGAGDFATNGKGLGETVSLLGEIRSPMVLVAGNHDDLSELRSMLDNHPSIHVLHGDAVTIKGLTILGLGFEIGEVPGALPSSILSEQAAQSILRSSKRADLLVTHAPPYGAADIQRDNTHQGSRAIRAWIEEVQPSLCLCGHIHHAWGTTGSIGDTRVHNLGPTLNWFRL
jgi:uncharacterized protein